MRAIVWLIPILTLCGQQFLNAAELRVTFHHSSRAESAEQVSRDRALGEILRPLSLISRKVNISDDAVPNDRHGRFLQRHPPANISVRSAKPVQWAASGLMHKPLYLEDVALERYGLTVSSPWQPVVSGARFYGSAATLPCRMGIEDSHDFPYALGFARPRQPRSWCTKRLPCRPPF